jgi:hypothetical protein
MRAKSRSIVVFSLSAIDLFASALGAFILVVFILFPYYNRGGENVSMEELEDEADRAREIAAAVAKESSRILTLEQQVELLDAEYLRELANLSRIQDETNKAILQLAAIEVPEVKTPRPENTPTPPRSVASGVQFSILGLATEKKRILVLVDMSSSMQEFAPIAERALMEIISTLKPDFQFAILGYHGANELEAFPATSGLTAANPQSVQNAIRFAQGLSRNYSGGTPTYFALQHALVRYPAAESIILMSDGEPTDGEPADIIRGVDQINSRKRVEIDTVAIGNYTADPKLTLFLQELANRNDGEFVGLSR